MKLFVYGRIWFQHGSEIARCLVLFWPGIVRESSGTCLGVDAVVSKVCYGFDLTCGCTQGSMGACALACVALFGCWDVLRLVLC